MFLWVLRVTLANQSDLMRVLLEPLMYHQLVRSTGDKLDLWLASEVRDGQSSRTEPLSLWDLIVSPGRKHQNWIELDCRTPGWCQRGAWSNGGKLHILERLNMRTETVKLLKENTGQNPLDIGLSNDFWGIWHQKHKKQKQKLISGTISNSKTAQPKKQSIKWNGKLQNRKKCINHISDKGLRSKLYKELLWLNSKKNKWCDVKWAEELNRYFSHRRHTDG